ncbi:hypothetical protein, partial [Bacillus subtilis]|uniref:hypothetical protein n=1 Tax=Bacillus subtilis TaxID=1423 RepID=UPI001BDBA7D6
FTITHRDVFNPAVPLADFNTFTPLNRIHYNPPLFTLHFTRNIAAGHFPMHHNTFQPLLTHNHTSFSLHSPP